MDEDVHHQHGCLSQKTQAQCLNVKCSLSHGTGTLYPTSQSIRMQVSQTVLQQKIIHAPCMKEVPPLHHTVQAQSTS